MALNLDPVSFHEESIPNGRVGYSYSCPIQSIRVLVVYTRLYVSFYILHLHLVVHYLFFFVSFSSSYTHFMSSLTLLFRADAMPMGRKWNVEKGVLFDVPTFEWLDAYETKATTFWLTMWSDNEGIDHRPINLVPKVSTTCTTKKDDSMTSVDVVMSDENGRSVEIQLF